MSSPRQRIGVSCWFAAAALLLSAAAGPCRADIFRWDNGQLIPGTEGIIPRPGIDLALWARDTHNLQFADFSGGLDLRDAGFNRSWLDNANFANANLTYAQFNLATLTAANLSGANLTNADLGSSTLTNANLSGANLTSARMTAATLAGANLSGALVADADFSLMTSKGLTQEQLYSTASYQQRNLPGIKLGNNDLRGWDFQQQDLGYAVLDNSMLAGAKFNGARIGWASMNGATAGGFTKEQLYSTASYQQHDLPGIGLDSTDLAGWDFAGQNLASAHFHVASLLNANLTNANLTEAFLSTAKLAGADFTGARIGGAFLNGASAGGFTKEQLYSTASYQEKNLGRLGLEFGQLAGWDFGGQNLAGADFYRANLTGANLAGADLTNVTLLDAKLAGAALAGAQISEAILIGATAGGFAKEQLYSTASYQQHDLHGIWLWNNDLTGWDLANQNLAQSHLSSVNLTGANLTGANLTGANLVYATLSGANFTGALITGAAFGSGIPQDFIKEQLYSTASYQQKNLQGVRLGGMDLTGWDFAGQNLANAYFDGATLPRANLTNARLENVSFKGAILNFADARGSQFFNPANATTRNMIWPDASIHGLGLAVGERLAIRDYAGSADQSVPPNVVRILSSLILQPSSQLDLGRSSLLISGVSLANVTAKLAQGYHGGAWDGFGIVSSAAASDPLQSTALGVLLNDAGDGTPVYATFAGLPAGAGDVLVRYTSYGDADLNGVVDGDDLVSFLVGYRNRLAGWANGDFDYNGRIDGDDLTRLLLGYSQQGPPQSAGGVQAVPEPGTLALLVLGAACLWFTGQPAAMRRGPAPSA